MPRLAPARMLIALLTSGAAVALLSGCQDQDRYAKLDSAYRTTLSENQRLTQEMDALRNEIDALRARIGQGDEALGAGTMTNAQLRQRLAQLMEDYRKLEERLNSLGVVLNPETDAALRALAEQHPDLIAYDAKRGMLRFKSDLTFALGSVEVQPAARQGLQQLAGVLTGSAASGYDLRIVGHTDDVPISAPGTLRDHKTNTHLSAHRAIAVRDVLAGSGVSQARLEVAGWGEYRPAVPNRGRGGTTENRRVEIFLVPGSGGSAAAPMNAAPIPNTTPVRTPGDDAVK